MMQQRASPLRTFLPYSDKRKQVMKVIFLVNEQDLSVITLTSMQYHDLLT